ncbi:MAG: efflux RND transporter periplasmic adaptor subunit [Pleomorphochaeta sp.]
MNKNKKNKKTGVFLVILIILAIGALGYYIYFDDSNNTMMRGPLMDSKEMSYTVYVEEMSPTTMTNYLEFNGDVVAQKSIDIYPDVTGEISSVKVSLGDYIEKGDIIVEVDPSLPGQNYSVNPVESTIDGTITDLPFDEGDQVSSTSTSIATVGDLSELELDCFISEKYMSYIQLGLDAEITFESYEGQIFKGSVVEISPVLDSSTRTLEIKIKLDENKDNIVKTGMFGSIKLITEVKDDVLSIPSSCISSGDEGYFVYVVSSDNLAKLTYVETGIEIDGRIEIISGLEEGDLVITRGQSMLKNGSTINIAQ